MTWNRLESAVVAMLFAGFGCASKGTTAPKPPPIADGVYEFSERPGQLQEAIEGTLTILGDTLLFDGRPGPCRYDEQASWGKNHPFTYRCAEITLTFDRYYPIDRAYYHTTTIVNDRRTVCVRYSTNAAGQQVCTQTETQTVPRQISVSGSLHPRRVLNP